MSLGITGRIASLSAREKVMLGGLAAVFLIFLGFLAYLLVGTTLQDLEDSVASKKEALEAIETLKDRYLQSRGSGVEATDEKLASNKIKLTPYVEEAAERLGITVEDYKERRVPVGKKHKTPSGEEVPEMWEELLTISFNQVTLDRLTSFLDDVDQPPQLVFIKKLALKRSWSEKSLFRVTVTLSTYKKA